MSLQNDLQVNVVRELLIVLGDLITAFDFRQITESPAGFLMANHFYQDLIIIQLNLSKMIRENIHKLQSALLANPTNLIVRVMIHSRLLNVEGNDYKSLLEIANNENAFIDFIRKYNNFMDVNTQYSTDIVQTLIDPKHPIKYTQVEYKAHYNTLRMSYKQLAISTRF